VDEITQEEFQSIIEVLRDFQDEIGDFHLVQLDNLKGELGLRYNDYVVSDLCVIASLGTIFANNRLTEFGFNLTKEQVKRIQEDEYCEDAKRAIKQLEESNR
jgi:hypothetical protein